MNEPVWAQNTINSSITSCFTNSTNVIDSFRAQGQISSLASDTLAGRTENSTENVIWALGGDWKFNVVDGNHTSFVVDVVKTKVDGTASHKHTIEKLNNASGMPMGNQQPQQLNLMTGKPSSKIDLVNGNATMFRGTADLTTNESVDWPSVPIHANLFNGNELNLGIDPEKTEDHFQGVISRRNSYYVRSPLSSNGNGIR